MIDRITITGCSGCGEDHHDLPCLQPKGGAWLPTPNGGDHYHVQGLTVCPISNKVIAIFAEGGVIKMLSEEPINEDLSEQE